MTRGTALLLIICILASILSFAQSDSLIRGNHMNRTFTPDSFQNNIINSRQSDTMQRGLPALDSLKRF